MKTLSILILFAFLAAAANAEEIEEIVVTAYGPPKAELWEKDRNEWYRKAERFCKQEGAKSEEDYQNCYDTLRVQFGLDPSHHVPNAIFGEGLFDHGRTTIPGFSRDPAKKPQPSTTSSTTTTPPNQDQTREQRISTLAEEYESESRLVVDSAQKCLADLEAAELCCAHPEKCIGETLGSGEAGSVAYKALQIAGGLAGQFPASSIGAVCGRMKTVASGFAVINSALSLKCSEKVRQCKASCAQVAKNAQKQLDATKQYSLQDRHEINNLTYQVRSELQNLASRAGDCSRYDNAAAEKALQAVSSAYASKMADICKNQASTLPDPNELARNQFNVDCSSPANAANPICQNQCARQGWENDPVCRAAAGLPPLGSNPGGLNTPSPAPNLPPIADSTGLDEFEDKQQFDGALAEVQSNKVNAGGQGGGNNTVLGGGGGDFGGGGAGGNGQGGGEGGFNTNVLAGNVRTGGGFSVPMMRGSAGGGYRGGARNARAPANAGKPFNPKDYLPGGRLDPKRKIAGIASATPDIGAVHGDVFKNISTRFYEICLRDGLLDCATLRKRGRPR